MVIREPVTIRLFFVVLVSTALSCGGPPQGEAPEARPDTNEREAVVNEGADSRPSIREVMAKHRDEWMGRPDVTGMGIGRCDEEPCIVLYLTRRSEELDRALPDRVEGYRVRLEVTGPFEARPQPDDTTEDES